MAGNDPAYIRVVDGEFFLKHSYVLVFLYFILRIYICFGNRISHALVLLSLNLINSTSLN